MVVLSWVGTSWEESGNLGAHHAVMAGPHSARVDRGRSDSEVADLVRPDPDEPWIERLRARRGISPFGQWPWRETGLSILAATIGVTALVVGSVWGWQRWSDRSAAPLDDLLPTLDLAAVGVVESGPEAQASDPVDGEASTAGATPVTEAAAVADEPTEARPDAPPNASSSGTVEVQVPTPLVVHVSGAVASPGVVEVAAGQRVIHAVDAAGGPLPDADTARVNLAAPVGDGERIHIPAIGEGPPPDLVPTERPASPVGGTAVEGGSAGTASAPGSASQAIDLNRATAAELEALPGVGPTIAQAIAGLRAERGPFDSVDELMLVPGIGPAKLEQIRPFAVVPGR